MNLREFFIDKFYYDNIYILKDKNSTYFEINIFNFFEIINFKFKYFLNTKSILKNFMNLYIYDYSILSLIKKKKDDYLISNIFFNYEFEKLILLPLKFFIIPIIFNNFIVLFFFFTHFLKFLKFEIYLKFFFFYFFNCFYFIFFYFINKIKIKTIISKYFYVFFIKIYQIKYLFFIIFEIILNKILFKILFFFKKFKIFILCLLSIYFFFNLNLNYCISFFSVFFIFNNFLYFYLFLFEFPNYIFENILIEQIFNHLVKIHEQLSVSYNFNLQEYFSNYKNFIYL